VFENLRCSPQGLSTEQAEQRLAIFGPNKLEEKQVSDGFRGLWRMTFLFLLLPGLADGVM
jgi:hypothetical protein